jgi:hypothetical protein
VLPWPSSWATKLARAKLSIEAKEGCFLLNQAKTEGAKISSEVFADYNCAERTIWCSFRAAGFMAGSRDNPNIGVMS